MGHLRAATRGTYIALRTALNVRAAYTITNFWPLGRMQMITEPRTHTAVTLHSTMPGYLILCQCQKYEYPSVLFGILV